MKTASTISRFLLGLMLTVFGLNGFFHFLPQPPPASPLALQYIVALATSGYLVPVFALQLVGGLLLLANRYVALGLTLLAPILVNILLYHFLMDPAGTAPGLVASTLWILVYIPNRKAFAGLLSA
jgi:putative oxidoreductase